MENNNYTPIENEQQVQNAEPVQPAYAEQPAYAAPEQPAPAYEEPAYAEPQPVYQEQPVYVEPQPVYNQPSAPLQQLESLASSSLTMGILGLVLGCIFGIIFGAIGKSKAKQFALLNGGAVTGKAKAGSILSTIALVLGIISTIFVFIYVVIIVAFLETNYHY